MIAWTIFLTFGGAVLALVLPRGFVRWIALVTTIAGLGLAMIVFVDTPIPDLAHFTTIVSVRWVPALEMNYHLALDGVSLTMVSWPMRSRGENAESVFSMLNQIGRAHV